MFTFSTVALLWALALRSPIAPVVITVKVFDSRVPVTVTVTAVALTIPPSAGRITSGVFGTVTSARPPTDVFTETPKASPLTLFPLGAVVSLARAVDPPARPGGPPPGLLDGGAGHTGEPHASPKIRMSEVITASLKDCA